jgi:hypothetical protein
MYIHIHKHTCIYIYINTQLEFERTAMTLIKNPLYKGKKVLFVSGVNVDVSPSGA